jgi:hypothetical protein
MPEKSNSNRENSSDNLEKNLESYRDVEGLSTKELNYGLWFVEHKKIIKNIVIIVLTLLNIGLWTYSIYYLIDYYAKGKLEDEKLVASISSENLINHDMVVSRSAKNLEISEVGIVSSGSKKDFFVNIQNSNSQYRADFQYCFVSGGIELKCGNNFILPSENKYVLSLNQQASSVYGEIQFVINNLDWQRINVHSIPSWLSYRNEHINFEFSGIIFSKISADSQLQKNLNNLEFIATNNTPYNYKLITLDIILYSGNAIKGINQYILSDFKSGEFRKIQLNWADGLGNVSNINILPDVDIMDTDVYFKFEGGTGSIK